MLLGNARGNLCYIYSGCNPTNIRGPGRTSACTYRSSQFIFRFSSFPITMSFLSAAASTSTTIAILGAGIFAKEGLSIHFMHIRNNEDSPTEYCTAHLPALAELGTAKVILGAVYSRSYKSASGLAEAAKQILKLESPPKIYSDDNEPGSTLDALLARSDIDAVIIALPITTQPAIIIKCLRAGKHVLSEKPVAPDVKSGLSLIATYEKDFKPKGLIWRVAENYEAEPGYLRAAEVIRQGKIGAVRFFRLTAVGYIDKDGKYYKTPWRTVPDVRISP